MLRLRAESVQVYYGLTCLTILLNGKVSRLLTVKGKPTQQKVKTDAKKE